MSNKGIIPAYAIYGAAVALLIVAGFFYVMFQFYGSTEITISDKIADGLTSINYFYLTEKNINEFAQIVTEITAKELGEQCGGFDCYSWDANSPTYQDLRDKFESELRGKITGFPKNIGNLGRLSFAPPRISGLEMDESRVKISLLPQQVYRKTDAFFVNSSSNEEKEIDKNIRYLLLAKIGQKLYGNGTYARDWSKVFVNSGTFDCNGDRVAEKSVSGKKLSEAGVSGCKIMSIDFDVDDIDGSGNSKWSGMGDYCKGKRTTVYEPGVNAGKVESNKLYVQIDNLLEYSLICGVESTDGLASVTDTKGEVSKSGESQVSCNAKEAGMDAWQDAQIQEKMQDILDALADFMEKGQTQINADVSAQIGTGTPYKPANSQSGWTVSCGKKAPVNPGREACAGRGECDLISQYCKIGDACAQETNTKCSRVTGDCQYKDDDGRERYGALQMVEGEYGYCCPKEYPVFDSYTKTCGSASEENLKIEPVSVASKPAGKEYCNSCREWQNPPDGQAATGTAENPSCIWSNSGTGDVIYSWSSQYDCKYSGNENTGTAITDASYSQSGSFDNAGFTTQNLKRTQEWRNGIFSETRHEYYFHSSVGGKTETDTYSCNINAYFRFTFTPDISFKITDNTLKVVKKGGPVGGEAPRFEDLYMAVKFKPQQSYQIGPGSVAPQKPEQGVPHAPAVPAPQESKIIITAEGKDITI